MKVWVGNLAPEVSAEEVKQLLEKYGFPEPKSVLAVPGEGNQPGMVVEFQNVNREFIRQQIERINGLYWKGHLTSVTVLPHF